MTATRKSHEHASYTRLAAGSLHNWKPAPAAACALKPAIFTRQPATLNTRQSGKWNCCAAPTNSASPLSGGFKLLLGLEKRVTDEEFSHWSELNYDACTVCNKCSMVCPMGIDLGSLLHGVRAGLAAAECCPS